MSNVIYRSLIAEQYKPKVRNSLNKRSDLIRVYNNIVNISKQSPLYMFHIDEESQNYAIQMKEAAMEYCSFLSTIKSGGMSEIFNSKLAVSSDPETVAAEIITEDNSSLPAPFRLKVHQLAAKQVNVGRETEKGNFAIREGEYIFTVHMNNKDFDFKLHVEQRTTNHAVQIKIADTINRSKMGLEAQVISGRNSALAKLVIASLTTGHSESEPAFTLTDKTAPSRARGIVDYFSLNEITAPAANSKFELNDIPKESMSNSFSFNKSLKITLNSVTDGDINIDYTANFRKIVGLLKASAALYNDMIDIAKQSTPSQKRAVVLINDLNKLLMEQQKAMEAYGIMMNEDHLVVDETIASEAAKSGRLEQLFTNDDTIFAKLQKHAAFISINPMHYVDKTMVTYPNHTSIPYPNPYITSIYSGMLCNCYC